MEERACARPREGLVHGEFPPVAGAVEVEEEAGAEEHHSASAPDHFLVAAGFGDDYACGARGEGEGEDEWEDVYAGEERGVAADGLEVEWEEVAATEEDDAVGEGHGVGGDVGAVVEEAEGDDGASGVFPFDEEEGDEEKEADGEEGDDDGAVPGVLDAAEFEADKEEEGAADDEEGAGPVDAFEAVADGDFGGLEVEEDLDCGHGGEPGGDVDDEAEAPAPGGHAGEDAAEDGADGGGKGPGHADEGEVEAALADRDDVGDRDVDEAELAAGADALDYATCEHECDVR